MTCRARKERRWRLPHLDRVTVKFLAERVERLCRRGMSFDDAMERITRPFKRTA